MKYINSKRIKLTCAAGLFAALITAATVLVRIPVAHSGYYHAGDSVIYIAASLLPGWYALAASSIGGAMADLIAGAPQWMIATAIIKPLNALPFIAARHILKKSSQDNRILHPLYAAMLIPTSIITIIGYYIAEGIMFGFDYSLWSSLLSGWIQPLASGAVYFLLGMALDKIKFKSVIFEKLFCKI